MVYAGKVEVFDATVPTYHNFIASDVIVHNSLEQDANMVLFIHRESLYDDSIPDTMAELIVGKNRNGPSSVSVSLNWEGRCVRFTDPPEVDSSYGEF